MEKKSCGKSGEKRKKEEEKEEQLFLLLLAMKIGVRGEPLLAQGSFSPFFQDRTVTDRLGRGEEKGP